MKHSTNLFKAITILVLTALVFATLPMNSAKAEAKADITTGLILHWTFDEGSGTTVNDSSGNGINGTIVGTRYSWSTDVPPGIGSTRSIYLDGLNNSNTWVQSAPSALFPSGSSPRTLCAWAKSRDGVRSTGAEHIVNYGQVGGTRAFGYMIFGSTWYTYTFGAGDFDSGVAIGTAWHDQCVTYDGTTMRYYMDGVQIASGAVTLFTTANTRMVVGEREDFAWDRYFDGWVDDVRLYNRALTAADVTQIHSGFSLNVSGNYNYITSSPAIAISAPLTATSNPVGQNINGATVIIGTNFNAGDTLAVAGYTAPWNGISWSYNAVTGVLTFAGNSSINNYQTLLKAVTFSSTSAVLAARTVTFSLGAALPYSGNGHFYEYVSASDIDWTAANTAASGRTYFGRQGYLATITSAGENAFAATKIGAAGAWLGGNDAATENTWQWVTGPEAGTTFCAGTWGACAPFGGAYTNWSPAEPNGGGGGADPDEDYLQFAPSTFGMWNDVPEPPGVGWIQGYVVEYGGLPSDDLMPISGNVTVNVASLLTVASHTLQAAYTGTGPSSFTVTFSEPVDNAGGGTGTDDAGNPDNYVVMEQGSVSGFQTTACNNINATQDTRVTPSGVTYIPNTTIVNFGSPLPTGTYRLFVCGTTSIVNLGGLALAGNGTTSGTDFTFDFTVGAAAAAAASSAGRDDGGSSGAIWLPSTGFAPNVVTRLPEQPDELAYTRMSDLWLEIPSQNVKANIVGVPQSENVWDVKWLGNDAGWLNGTAFPSWVGNSVLTAHVMGADGLPGPFAKLQDLKYGERIIVHMLDQQYVFEVRNKRLVRPDSTAFAFEHLEDASYLTLITCSGYNEEKNTYSFRRLVRAVLVEVK